MISKTLGKWQKFTKLKNNDDILSKLILSVIQFVGKLISESLQERTSREGMVSTVQLNHQGQVFDGAVKRGLHIEQP